MDIEELYISQSETTFEFDENLPNLPIPPLEQTLGLYLESVRPHLNDEELKKTTELVDTFAERDGPKLQELLLERSKKHRNWLEKWWEETAYLSQRLPLIPYSNTCGVFPLKDPLWAPDSIAQIPRAALVTYFVLKYYKLLRSEKVKPDKSRGANFSMSQFRRCFNTIRIPSQQSDELKCSFVTEREGPLPSKHIIVLCKGYIYQMTVFDSEDEPFTPTDLEQQFQHILDEPRNLRGCNVASLTYDDRKSWAKNRERLVTLHANNSSNLKEIENAIMFLSLDAAEPKTDDEICQLSLGGEVGGRWADSTTLIVYKNGTVAFNADHTPCDGMVGISLNHFIYLNVERIKGKWSKDSHVSNKIAANRGIRKPIKLDFVLDSLLREEIETVTLRTSTLIGFVNCCVLHFNGFGKSFITSKKINPDTFVQLALQLAYYRTHEKPGPTYETASTRGFYNGRTETVRSCTTEGIRWSKAMMANGSTGNNETFELFKNAIERHDFLMKMSRENQGCDRHLLGLYLTAVETGSDIPHLYTDPAFVKSGGNGNFILSTSLVGYTAMSGAAAAMCRDGYGVFYCISTSGIRFNITTWKNSKETNAVLFSSNIEKSLHEMQTLSATWSNL